MKILISESQVKKLINNLVEEKSQIDIVSDYLSNPMGSLIDNLSPEAIEKLRQYVGQSDNTRKEVAPNIPSGKMMHPLGNKKYGITSQFGLRNGRNHNGVDLKAASGTPVYAPADGIIESARDTTPDGCGGFVKINHRELNLITKYCHLRDWSVKVNQEVKKGDLIGHTGGGKNDPYRGDSTGPHLHYEILNSNNIAMNPINVQNDLA